MVINLNKIKKKYFVKFSVSFLIAWGHIYVRKKQSKNYIWNIEMENFEKYSKKGKTDRDLRETGCPGQIFF